MYAIDHGHIDAMCLMWQHCTQVQLHQSSTISSNHTTVNDSWNDAIDVEDHSDVRLHVVPDHVNDTINSNADWAKLVLQRDKHGYNALHHIVNYSTDEDDSNTQYESNRIVMESMMNVLLTPLCDNNDNSVNDSVDMCHMVLNERVHTEKNENNGSTAIILATRRLQYDLVKKLLAYGAEPLLIDEVCYCCLIDLVYVYTDLSFWHSVS